jgi:hypothetical protein
MSGNQAEWGPDYGWWDQNDTDDRKIGRKTVLPCRICQEQFARVTLTFRYCKDCGCAFCEGVHGSLATVAHQQVGRCVLCYLGSGWSPGRRPSA